MLGLKTKSAQNSAKILIPLEPDLIDPGTYDMSVLYGGEELVGASLQLSR